ncbi:unnamed protein product [Nippostrongylus brasiliensis]|uniref:G_PROTEIN_RECEP_F1_2 domain-containing protein n=1 Tax=Nippostrongylus brasiliensis TaxID=27835 RepID=A0A0N4YCA5_NIPBR|nr:unnamed protein product [Nippostrongylus brasiliensis]
MFDRTTLLIDRYWRDCNLAESSPCLPLLTASGSGVRIVKVKISSTFHDTTTLGFHTLIFAQLVIFFVHSVFIIGTQLMHLWKYSFSKSPCDIVTSALTCTILRFPLTTSFTSFVILQLASSVLLVTWTILPEKFTNVYPYCSSGSNQTINRLSLINMFLCGLCMTSLVGIVAFKFYNRYAVDRRTYNLRDSFHLRENRHIVQLLFPLVLFQAGFLLVFTTIGAILPSFRGSMAPIIFRTAFCATYLIPYYTVVTPLIILAMIRKAQKNNVRRLDMMRNPNEDNDSNKVIDKD